MKLIYGQNNRGQDFGDATWKIISSMLPRTSSILVWGGCVTLGIGSLGSARIDLAGSQQLGENNAKPAHKLAKCLLAVHPVQLSTLNLRWNESEVMTADDIYLDEDARVNDMSNENAEEINSKSWERLTLVKPFKHSQASLSSTYSKPAWVPSSIFFGAMKTNAHVITLHFQNIDLVQCLVYPNDDYAGGTTLGLTGPKLL